MFKNKANKSTTMKSFLIPAVVMLIILTAWGRGNSDNILVPAKSNPEVLAAPGGSSIPFHIEGWIVPAGGTIYLPGFVKVIVPEGAVDNPLYITIDAELYIFEKEIHYILDPHGTVFNKPIRIEIYWSYLTNYDGPLQLWYLEDNGEWGLVEDAIVDEPNKRWILYINHFSEYYFLRH